MKILFVAMGFSVHTARWIAQIADKGWEIYLFPVPGSEEIHPELKNVKVIRGNSEFEELYKNNQLYRWYHQFKEIVFGRESSKSKLVLARVIDQIKPDIIHSFETQHSGYLVSEARENVKGKFPIWIHSLWGSDVYLFGRLKEHRKKIIEMLRKCNYLICENRRDELLSRDLGFKKKIYNFQMTGGFNFLTTKRLKRVNPTAKRTLIALKGYQGWSGRALVGIRALEKCVGMLANFNVVIFSVTSDDVKIAAELLAISTGVKVSVLTSNLPHNKIMELFGKCRVFIGLGISDGVPNTMLEAMLMGAFPIQSNTAATEGWIENGKNGLLVRPDDPEGVEKALQKVLSDDRLVNQAAVYNYRLLKKKLDEKNIKPEVLKMYEEIALQ